MKKWTRTVVALLMATTLIGCGSALAANETAGTAEPAVAVQLDGKDLAFTDAVPQVKDQRTFLPFRAVFEAMGAEVGNEGTTITAKRGDKTLTMVIGSTNAVVSENGVETPIVMDVAPYVDNATWRTYVPVRFAAQAFDCSVGWDQANYTAIIVDTDKLLDEAKAGKSYTYLEKFVAYSEKYNTGLWDSDFSFDGSMNVADAPLAFAGTASAVTEGRDKFDMKMNMTMDMLKYMEALNAQMAEAGAELEPMTAEEKAMLEKLSTDGIDLAMRGDMTKGLLYMNAAGPLLDSIGMSADTWYSMDLNTVLSQSEIALDDLKSMDYDALLKMAAQSVELTDASTDYAGLKLLVEKVADILSDASFTRSGKYATNRFAYTESGVDLEIVLKLTMSGDKVVGYELQGGLKLSEEGAAVMDLSVRAAVDEKDRLDANFKMAMAGLVDMTMNMKGGYTKGATAPVTVPPAGAKIVPMDEMFQPAA